MRCVPADVDETPKRGELPRACANRLARAKADAALKSVQLDDELRGAFILAADTVVAVGRRILPKANLVDEASQCLRLLSGRNHRVYTAICLVTPKETFRQRLIETRVRFKRLSEDDIQAYIGSGEWRGKAGGYAVQGIAGSFVVKMVGSYTNIVGLPLYEFDHAARRRRLSDPLRLAECRLSHQATLAKIGPAKAPAKPCPICGKPATEASRPFCSERCRDVDLNRWLSSSYAIPAAEEDEDDGIGDISMRLFGLMARDRFGISAGGRLPVTSSPFCLRVAAPRVAAGEAWWTGLPGLTINRRSQAPCGGKCPGSSVGRACD